jgi:hypothetical protein
MRTINSQEKSPTIRKILRLLTLNRACGKPSIGDNEKHQLTDPGGFNAYTLRATNFALIEAELRKAEALMQSRKISFIW